MSKNKGYSKRPGSQKVQTKRSSKNKYKFELHAGYAVRMLQRSKYFKLKCRGE